MCIIWQISLLALVFMDPPSAYGIPSDERRFMINYDYQPTSDTFPYFGLVHIHSVRPDGAFTDYFCGSAIIKPEYLLSAAHCYLRYTIKSMKVNVGIGHRTQGVQYELDPVPDFHFDYRNATDYKRNYYYNDLAVLFVVGAIVFNEHVQPISVDAYDPDFSSSGGIIHFVGVRHYWYHDDPIEGYREPTHNEFLTTVLNSTERLIGKLEDCKQIYLDFNGIDAGAKCSLPYGKTEPKHCFGSMGGPVVYKPRDEVKRRLIGIISAENTCNGSPLPFVSMANTFFYIKLVIDPV